MATELFPRGAAHHCTNEIAYLTGANTIAWTMHPEEAFRRVVEAGGMQDAYGRDYTIAEFIQLLREKDHARGTPPCEKRCTIELLREVFGHG